MSHSSWQHWINIEKSKPYFREILNKIDTDISHGNTVYPPKNQFLHSLELTPLEATKIVIIGQDPYHGPNEAHGLAFSVPDGIKIPPSLRNIYKELASDLQVPQPTSGNLSTWAKQGVLLLNTSLSVIHKQPGSHAKIGWQTFTDAIIAKTSQSHQHLVFILWGAHAQSKKHLIASHHLILESPHPSPLSAHRGFFGSKPFSKANHWLEAHNKQAINWQIT